MENNEQKIKEVVELAVENPNAMNPGLPNILEKQNFELRHREICPKGLNLNHPFYNTLDINPNEYYTKEFEHFTRCYDMPFVALVEGEYYVLSHREEVMAANNCGKPEIEIMLIEGLGKDEFARFISYRSFYTQKGYKNQYDSIRWLEKHFKENIMGKEWADEIPGDMKKKLATILGVSESTIQNLKQIGESNREDLIKLDNKEITLSAVLKSIRPEKKDSTSGEVIPVEKTSSKKQCAITPVKNNKPAKNEDKYEIEKADFHQEVQKNTQTSASVYINEDLDLSHLESKNDIIEVEPLFNAGFRYILIETNDGRFIEIDETFGKFMQINLSGDCPAIFHEKIDNPDGSETNIFKSSNRAGSFEIISKNLNAFCED